MGTAIYHAQQSKAEIVGIIATPLGATTFSYAPTYIEQDVVNAKKILNDAEKVVVKHNISFNSKILHGNTGNEIVKFAEDNNFDLIAIGARGIGSVKEAFLGQCFKLCFTQIKKTSLNCKMKANTKFQKNSGGIG